MSTSRMSMRKIANTERGGFTIIEVVLVLAIAGLIFLMVFLALPQLRRSQADSQRRRDMGNLVNAVQQYQVSEGGPLPRNGSVDSFEEKSTGAELATWCPTKASSTTSTTGTGSPAGCFIKEYMNGNTQYNEFLDPRGQTYALTIMDLAKGATHDVTVQDYEDYRAYLVKHAHCNGTTAEYSANSRDYAVMYKLEGNGAFCEDNNN